MWRATRRLGDGDIIFYLGDHDPSGIDMTRDIRDRLRMFGVDVEIDRLALNMDQVKKYNPPPNPAKMTDTRCHSYVSEFGNESWELDALEPRLMAELVKHAILNKRNENVWKRSRKRERAEK